MAYENYTQVSWSAGTPITGDRLQQMSQNIQEVKDATDDKPKGILRLKTTTASFSSSSFGTINVPTLYGLGSVVSLINEGAGSPDNRVTSEGSRFLRININFPGFAIASSGQEDALYEIGLIEQDGGTSSNSLVATWQFTTGPLLYIDRTTIPSSNANIFGNAQVVSNISPLLAGNKVSNNSSVVTFSTAFFNSTLLKQQNANTGRLAGGTYSYIRDTGTGITNNSYYVIVNRKAGANTNNASTFSILTSSPIQFYVEDVGGTL